MATNRAGRKDWKEVKRAMDKEMTSLAKEEPEEIRKLRLGFVVGNVGSYGQYFSVMVKAYTTLTSLADHIAYGCVAASEKKGVDLKTLVAVTEALLGTAGAQPTETLRVAGFGKVHDITLSTLAALSDVKNLIQYEELMTSYWTYVSTMRNWLDGIFPWSLGLALYPKLKPDDIKAYKGFMPLVDEVPYF